MLGVLLSVVYRNPLLFVDPQMFSEDVFVYFNEHRLLGSAALIEFYSGYLQICCRLIAFIVGFAPARYAAALYAAFFVLTIVATSAVLYTSPIFTGWGKVLAALALVCSPTNSEVFFGMCYTQWIMAPIVGLALYESPTTKGRLAVLLTYFAIVGLSSPLVIIAAPFVAWKALNERTRYSLALCALTALSATIQLHGILGRTAANAATGTKFERAFAATSVFYSWLTGPHYPGFAVAAFVSVITLVAVSYYLWSNRKAAYRPAVYFLAYGALAVVAGCLQVDASLHANQFLFGARYFYVTIVFIVLAIIIIEQNSVRHALTLPVTALVLGAIYAAHVRNMNVHFTNRTWPQVADCVEHSSNCVTLMNPGNTGYIRVPSDSELKLMSLQDRLQFRTMQRRDPNKAS